MRLRVVMVLAASSFLSAASGSAVAAPNETEKAALTIATCAVKKMSTAAKQELARREHKARMETMRDGSSPVEPPEWNEDISAPLTRSCMKVQNEPLRRLGTYRIWTALLEDDEFKDIYRPLYLEYRKALLAYQAEKKKLDEGERKAQGAKEAWLFKDGQAPK